MKSFFIIGITLFLIIIIIHVVNSNDLIRNEKEDEYVPKEIQDEKSIAEDIQNEESEVIEQKEENTKEENLKIQSNIERNNINNKESSSDNENNYASTKSKENIIKNNVQSQQTIKKSEQKCNNDTIITQEDFNKNVQSTKKIDLSKYDYYEKNPNGSYNGFIEDAGEISKLKSLIDETINSFGYKNVKVIKDKSLSKDGTPYFTANKTNVNNAIYDCEGFSVYYYAIKEYVVSTNGAETYFQTRCYIKVK